MIEAVFDQSDVLAALQEEVADLLESIQLPTQRGIGTVSAHAQDIGPEFKGLAGPDVAAAGASQAAVTLGNADSEIGGLPIGATYSQAEVQALRDQCEELADDARALSTLLHATLTGLVNAGLVKGAA